MQSLARIGTWMVFGATLAASQLLSPSAQAARTSHRASHGVALASVRPDRGIPVQYGHRGTKRVFAKGAKVRYASYSVLQCVPFARAASGIAIRGNAANWWSAAAGVYDRGNAPETGSVLNFRSTGRMRLGHVAVVAAIDDPRHIEIDQANWSGPGSISRNIPVEDVSAGNDWTAVRVGLGHTGEYGSVYPTYGFIYGRPDNGGTGLASRSRGEPQSEPTIELAQAPDGPIQSGTIQGSGGAMATPVVARVSGRVAGILDDAPSHGVR